MTLRYFYDCEFIEDGVTIDLVSIGVVCEDGREYYAVSTEFDERKAGPWVRRNVLPKLPAPASPLWRDRATIRDELYRFLVPRPAVEPQLWAWVGAYDHVALCQLWGSMVDLPGNLPRYTNELRQYWDMSGRPPLPPVPKGAHDALTDARHNLAKFEAVEAHLRRTA
ncbi:polyadenylate-specific 3'-exoribonuclease AS [Nocardia stercoris]|uniref:3'-5' exoribonuclease n=1 Tax=Nocardia stercoris TaxID=2483361 RepID=A0A3M2KZZ6_9NOCA|nr:polyadenylate-specific 3'-exoribonuclease AS [Nocardia stercoris]RMI29105.1 polyadenylate-specific 3'-exoribonuclease AS [Nocardia stercoris]